MGVRWAVQRGCAYGAVHWRPPVHRTKTRTTLGRGNWPCGALSSSANTEDHSAVSSLCTAVSGIGGGSSVTDAHSSKKRSARWDVPTEDLPARVMAAPASSRLFLLPDQTIDGVGIYRDDVAGLVKTLRRRGVDIDFASAREDRRYLSEYGAGDLVAIIGLAVAGNLTSELIQGIAVAVWHRARSALGTDSTPEQVDSANVTVRVAEIVRNDHEVVVRGLEVTSPVADVEGLIRGLISDRMPPQLPPGMTDTPGQGVAEPGDGSG